MAVAANVVRVATIKPVWTEPAFASSNARTKAAVIMAVAGNAAFAPTTHPIAAKGNAMLCARRIAKAKNAAPTVAVDNAVLAQQWRPFVVSLIFACLMGNFFSQNVQGLAVPEPVWKRPCVHWNYALMMWLSTLKFSVPLAII